MAMSAKQEASQAISMANQQAQATNGRAAQQQKAQQQKEQAEEQQTQIREILRNCLHEDALSRLDNIRLVKPDKHTAITRLLLQMIQSKQVAGKISDEYLKKLLGEMNKQIKPAANKIQFKRKGMQEDSDDENYWSD